MDYNGYRKKKGAGAKYRIRYPINVQQNNADENELQFLEFSSLSDFKKKTGFEVNGVELDDHVFINVKLPDPKIKGHVYQNSGYNFQLNPSGRAIDAGHYLPNITEEFTGKAPDLGALESGKKEPAYGPRIR
jgi:hypothetical protein